MFTVIAPVVLGLSLTLAAPAGPGRAGLPATLLAAGYWAPPERSKKPKQEKKPAKGHSDDSSSKSTEKLEEEVLDDDSKPKPEPRAKARPKPKNDEDAEEEGEDEEEDAPKVRRRSHAVHDEDEDTEMTPSLAPVAAHVLSFGLGASVMGRRFAFDTALQQEKAFGRPGAALTLELYPLLLLGGWMSRIGLAADFEREFGSAGLSQMDGGTLQYGVSQTRWEIDVRYSFAAGERFVLAPQIGYGHSGYDVQRKMETTPPSMCTATAAAVCIPDVAYSHVTLGAIVRAAFSPSFGMSLALAYLPAFGVGKAPGQLASETAPATANGFGGELGASLLLNDWLAVRATIPVVRYAFVMDGPNMSYRSASEMYYGVVAGIVVWAK